MRWRRDGVEAGATRTGIRSARSLLTAMTRVMADGTVADRTEMTALATSSDAIAGTAIATIDGNVDAVIATAIGTTDVGVAVTKASFNQGI